MKHGEQDTRPLGVRDEPLAVATTTRSISAARAHRSCGVVSSAAAGWARNACDRRTASAVTIALTRIPGVAVMSGP
jgi:hypothetical protein